MLRKKADVKKVPASEHKTGRPPKNMCKPCKGWGQLWSMLTKVYYYGSGEEAVNLSELKDSLRSEECTDCKGTGYTGGKLRNETPPILVDYGIEADIAAPKTAKNSSEVIEHYEENKELYNATSESRQEGGMVI